MKNTKEQRYSAEWYNHVDEIIAKREQEKYNAKTLKLTDTEIKELVDKYKQLYLQYGHNKDLNVLTHEDCNEMYYFFKYLTNWEYIAPFYYKTWYDLFYEYNYLIYSHFYENTENLFQNEFDYELNYEKRSIEDEAIEFGYLDKLNDEPAYGILHYADSRIIPLFKEFLKIVPEAKRKEW